LNYTNCTKPKQKNKHLTFDFYEKIQSEYNRYISSKDNPIKKTAFMKNLASFIGTSLSNLYDIINDGLITTINSNYEELIEFNAITAYERRTKKSKISNFSKINSSKDFVDLVVKEFRCPNNINSIDEIINDLIRNRPSEIEGMVTISTSTFYNYVEQNKIDDFNKYDLPMKTKRAKNKESKKGKTKPKGTSIDERPFTPDDRSEFGHWEGDTVVSGKDGKGALLTLVERKSRHLLVVPLSNLKAKTISKAFYKLRKLYPDFEPKEVFKSITFDNGVEFSDYESIGKYLKVDIYFAHPYSSWERGSNENCNRLIRYFIPKGSDISKYSTNFILNATDLINLKIRKVLGYKSSLDLFNDELQILKNA